MRKIVLTLLSIGSLYILSYNFMSCNTSSVRNGKVEYVEDTVSNIDPHSFRSRKLESEESTTIFKNFYIPYGKDSLLMIPDWAIENLYSSPLEAYRKKYKNYEEFENTFLYSSKMLPDRLNWSYHIGINPDVMYDYHHMPFDDFMKKYLYVEGKDTMAIINDTTLAYCLDKHGYHCFFDYMQNGKTKVEKSRYIIQLRQSRVNDGDRFD